MHARLAGLVVSKGMNRIHVYLHTSNTRADIYALVNAYVTWGAGMAHDERVGPEGDRMRLKGKVNRMSSSEGNSRLKL